MRKLLSILIGVSVLGGATIACSDQSQSQESLENEANQKIKVFATQLKSALVGAIQTDGLQKAVKVCEEQAPQIAQSLSTNGWTIARTSLKTRNENSQADDWEAATLQNFEQQHAAGADISTLSMSKLNDAEFRYMKAIPTGQVCLACHGSSVDPALQTSINALYPNDMAVGYALGDIRGAFTLTKAQ